MQRAAWMALSGAVWFTVGVWLLTWGLDRVISKAQLDVHEVTSWVARLSHLAGGREQAALLLITIALIVGIAKGRMAMGKAVRRVASRLDAIKGPYSLGQVYSK